MRVLIADDSVLLREGLALILADGGHEVVGGVGTGDELVAAPVDDFVVRFLGLEDARRALRLAEVAGRRVVQDETGRTLGVLDAAHDTPAGGRT